MSAPLSAQVLVVLTTAPSLESSLVDWLLSLDDSPGFTSGAVNGHSSRHDHLTIAEQVSGKQRRVQFQVQMVADRLDGFLKALETEFSGADVHYWAVPVIAAGRLG